MLTTKRYEYMLFDSIEIHPLIAYPLIRKSLIGK